MEKTYSIEKIQDFMRSIYCMSFENFVEMYKSIGEFYSSYYLQEKFMKKNQDMFTWFCELTPSHLEKMMDYIYK